MQRAAESISQEKSKSGKYYSMLQWWFSFLSCKSSREPSDLTCIPSVGSRPSGWEPLFWQTKGLRHVGLRVWHHYVTPAHPAVRPSPSMFSSQRNCVGAPLWTEAKRSECHLFRRLTCFYLESIWKHRVQKYKLVCWHVIIMDSSVLSREHCFR